MATNMDKALYGAPQGIDQLGVEAEPIEIEIEDEIEVEVEVEIEVKIEVEVEGSVSTLVSAYSILN
jgi:hypothetical protein